MPACPRDNLPILLLLKNHLERWFNSKGTSVQLDGSSTYTNNPQPWVTFSFGGQSWKLAGDTRDVAVEEFIRLFNNGNDGNNGARVLVQAVGRGGAIILRLVGHTEADGWYCTRNL